MIFAAILYTFLLYSCLLNDPCYPVGRPPGSERILNRCSVIEKKREKIITSVSFFALEKSWAKDFRSAARLAILEFSSLVAGQNCTVG